ncbi:MAG: hypothetical protein AAGA66_10565 [Bacteroidota bacterium]
MKWTEEALDKMEAYLAGTLNDDDLRSFEAALEENQELEDQLSVYQAMRTAMEDQGSIDFRRKLQQFEAGQGKRGKTRDLIIYRKIAAFLVVAFGLTWGIIRLTTSPSLFEKYYQPYPIESVKRGSEDSVKGASLYQAMEYEKAIPYLLMQLEVSEETDLYRLYLGNCYLQTNQEPLAVVQFSSVEDSSPYYQFTQWYLALTFLKKEAMEDTKKVLSAIIVYDGLYKDRAEELLKEID